MITSQRYRCPPGTGIPKEDMAMFNAMNRAVIVMLIVAIFVVCFIFLPSFTFAEKEINIKQVI